MIGPLTHKPQEQEAQNLTRLDLAALSLMSLLFGLAVIVRGLLHG